MFHDIYLRFDSISSLSTTRHSTIDCFFFIFMCLIAMFIIYDEKYWENGTRETAATDSGPAWPVRSVGFLINVAIIRSPVVDQRKCFF